jgi:hypothetical protein
MAYAWSVFHTERNEFGQPTKTVQPGEEINQEDLGISDEDWNGLLEAGAVRDEPYPDIPDNLSPAEHYKQQLAAMAAGELSPGDMAKVQARLEEQDVNPDTAKVSAGGEDDRPEATDIEEMESTQEYVNMTFKDLQAEASTRDIEGHSSMNKGQLIEALKANDASS